ncbi:hypothetical protein [Pyxidicoccus xibeiensis]|uniref:hypothetical protein n=1 Tax=Pyxidicoccus xibeiensis TaxID=2906759 RepID=UPI0020A7E815|nr:hypothetical protein [Pyxidicoccus xibeiensis]MCP3145363.1 hypothetical protein [Pyxidicoccus xibeiensis]
MDTGGNKSSLSELATVATVLRGHVLGPRRGVLVLGLDELLEERVEHAIVARVDGDAAQMVAKLKWECVGAFALDDSAVGCVGSRGRFAQTGSSLVLETIAGDLDHPGISGLLRDAVCIDGQICALSLDGRLLRRAAPGQWNVDMDLMLDAVMHRLGKGQATLDGLLAASATGQLYRRAGRRWSLLDTPSTAIINGIWQTPGGRFVACGMGGLLLEGDTQAMRVIEHDFAQENFWSICVLEGAAYVASLDHLYMLPPTGKLERIDPLDAATFNNLSATGDTLWSLGGRDVLELHGGQWHRIL